MNRLSSASRNSVLIVEGQNDKHVVIHLWQQQTETDLMFWILDKGSVEQALESIVPEVRAPDRQAVGILVDADDKPSARWDAVVNQLRRAGIDAPAARDPDGTIIDRTDEMPRVGVWVMPDNDSPGELEDFVAQMVPGEDPVWPRSQAYIDGIPLEDRKFTDGKTLRAKIHAWLAAREDPMLMGLAIKAHDLEVDGDLCARFVAWLDRLFGNQEYSS